MSKATAAKVAPADSAESLDERIDRRAEILDKIAATERNLESAVNHRDRVRVQLLEARNVVGGRRGVLDRLPKHPDGVRPEAVPGTTDARDLAALRTAEQDAQRLDTTLEQAESRIRVLRAELDHLQNTELPACDAETRFDELAAHCEKVAHASEEVRNLEKRLADQRQVISDLEAQRSTLADLNAQRENLLASVALGHAKKADVERFDEESKAKRAGIEAQNAQISAAIAEAQQTISGLQRFITEATAHRDNLRARMPAAVEQFLLSEGRRVHQAYLKAVSDIRGAYAELFAINRQLEELTSGKRRFITVQTTHMSLPAFVLPGGVPTDRPENDRGTIFRTSDASHGIAVAAAVQALHERLSGAGVTRS